MFFLLAFITVCIGLVDPLAVSAQNFSGSKKTVQLADDQLVRVLGSRNSKDSFEAAKEIFRRGDKIIPLLLRLKGDTRPFAWGSLGNSNSSSITFAPTGDAAWDHGRIVTVEVAAIYLISAFFHDDFEFAQDGYLKDKTEVEFKQHNTTERVQRAWSSVEKWVARWRAEGMQSLKATRQSDPLSYARMYF